MIWLTSDLHFCHNKDFIYAPRGFDSVEDMNSAIVSRWNEVVKDDDEVYVLGDLMLDDNEEGIRLWNELNGIKHIVLGNHDTDTRIELYGNCPRTDIEGYAKLLKYRGYHFYLSHYPTLTANFDENRPLKEKMINLCGHSHTSDRFRDMDRSIIYHVELDAHGNRPVSIDEVIDDLLIQQL